MAKIKGSAICLKYGTAKQTIAGTTNESIKLTTSFDETRDKSVSGPHREFSHVELTATISGNVEAAGAGQMSLADVQAFAKTGKVNNADLSAFLTVNGTAIVKVNKVIFSNYSATAPVGGKATWSVTVQGCGKVVTA